MELKKETIDEVDSGRETENLKKIEAALFIAGRWLELKELVMLTDINPMTLKQLLDRLQEKYTSDGAAIEILAKDDMWKMDVKTEYTNMVNKLATGKSEFTKAEQETLAIIAYKQPVKQSVIVNIRGNKCYEHIKKFGQMGLVKTKKVGHTIELELSEEFYEYFHVSGAGEGDDRGVGSIIEKVEESKNQTKDEGE